jgi:hypothetical protein
VTRDTSDPARASPKGASDRPAKGEALGSKAAKEGEKSEWKSLFDGEKTVDLVRKDRKLSIRWECEPCRPLGISTWCTAGAVRAIRVRPLKAGEIKEIAESAEKSEN